jgi:hypothetical protein
MVHASVPSNLQPAGPVRTALNASHGAASLIARKYLQVKSL